MSEQIRFSPVRGKENNILNYEHQDGNIYFSTDTKRIFLDTENENKLLIGGSGNSSIYYSTYQRQEDDEDSLVFTLDDLDFKDDTLGKRELPKVDDLILNIPDGSFYRVTIVDKINQEFYVVRLTVAGSGGGGESQSSSKLEMNYYPENSSTKYSLYRDKCELQFNVTALDADGERTGNGTGELFVNNISKGTFTVTQGLNTVEVGEYLVLGANTVSIQISMDVGDEQPKKRQKTWTINTVSVQLEWEYNEADVNDIYKDFHIFWKASGNVNKKLHVLIDGIYEVVSAPTRSTAEQDFVITDVISHGLTHGGHLIEAYVTAEVGDQTIRTTSVFKQALFRDIDSPQIMISYKLESKNLIQYDTVSIPIIIFNPEVEAIDGFSTVVLKEDGIIKDTWEIVKNKDINNWLYTPTKQGDTTLTILCGNEEKNIVINIQELPINNSEIGGYAFKFKATEFASNKALQRWSNNGVTAEFSDNFDWINGGLQTENLLDGTSRQYVCVKAGTTMTINYDLFKYNAYQNGKNVKIIFKASNCRDFNAAAINCYDETSGIGLKIQAQHSYLTSAQKHLTTTYCEDSYLEYEYDIWPSVDKTLPDGTDISQRYIISWLDGVPCGAITYPSDDTIHQNKHFNPIVIGSNDCDVYLYMMKVYEKHLDDDKHLANFIADAPNAKEMVERFDRNDILNDLGEIDPGILAKKNPDCRVHLYDIDHMTTNKDTDPVSGCSYMLYHGDGTAKISATDVKIQVQGTSSAAYGIAAFNIDTDFNDKDADGNIVSKVYDAEGNQLTKGKWSMDGTAIPVNYFTTKVNVASCEGANNAINQEWYNKFQPYVTKARQKNPLRRDTMQFYPGVLFIKDRNQNDNKKGVQDNVFKDTVGYIADPYYKLYAVCNMGNSKKNTDVVHDPDNPKEVCIEVTDNQKAGQWLTALQGYIKPEGSDEYIPVLIDNIDTDENYAAWEAALDDNNFDFRYPKMKDVKKADAEKGTHLEKDIKTAFFNFCSWMAHSDPSPKYKHIGTLTEDEFNLLTTEHKDENGNDVQPVKLYSFDNIIHTEQTEFTEGMDYYMFDNGHPYGYTDEPLDQPVTFSTYSFSNSEFTKVLHGVSITDYAGTYETDSYKYRMAKMLSECEEHLVMDSIVYHYLFIERHTMIDNVAKNTFWGTEDLQHWYFNKDYDNDTADGNDNEGKLSLRYGYEVSDMIDDRFVFNAHEAVWINFIQGLYPACEYMYKELAKLGAWDVDAYLNAFKRFQDVIPERCWIEDYHRKYLRPRQVYGSDDYIPMLEGGKKTHQRKQFEVYQNLYLNSKYAVGEDSEAVFFRANTQNMQNDFYLPVKMYCDCYVRSSIGQTYTKQRVKGGENNTIRFDHTVLGSMNDATCLLYPGELYTKIDDMSVLKPKEVRVLAAKRLQELAIGRSNENSNLESIAVGANVMLRKLEIAKCKNEKLTSLDLTSAIGLHELDISDSSFTGLKLAPGAPIEKIHLGSNLTSIQISNLEYINNFEMDGYEKITQLLLNNIDKSPGINSKDLVDNSPKLNQYNLQNVKWTIDDSNEISNGEISILERLLNINPRDVDDHIAALSGVLTITENAYNDADAVDIYNKYTTDGTDGFVNNYYPNLDIIFEGENAKLPAIYIYDGNNSLYWHRRIANNNNFTTETLKDGPNGIFDINHIYKSNTEDSTFEFSGIWDVFDVFDLDEIAKGENSEHWLKKIETSFTQNNALIFESVNKDLYFIPRFIQHERTYNLIFRNYDGTEIATVVAKYNQTLGNCYPDILPIKDSPDPAKTYKFLGYNYVATAPTPLDPEATKMKSEEIFYAIFSNETIDVHDNVLEARFLTFDEKTSALSPGKNVQLAGKITLPATYNGKPVLRLKDFTNQTEITYIFFEKGTQLTTIAENCFRGCQKLRYFEAPVSLTGILGQYAFGDCKKLEGIDLSNTSLTQLGNNAFNNAFGSTTENIEIKLPGTLEILGRTTSIFVFYSDNNNTISLLQMGTRDNPCKITQAATEWFYPSDQGLVDVLQIYVPAGKKQTIEQILNNTIITPNTIEIVEV